MNTPYGSLGNIKPAVKHLKRFDEVSGTWINTSQGVAFVGPVKVYENAVGLSHSSIEVTVPGSDRNRILVGNNEVRANEAREKFISWLEAM